MLAGARKPYRSRLEVKFEPKARHPPPPRARPKQRATRKSCAKIESIEENVQAHWPPVFRPEDVDPPNSHGDLRNHFPANVANVHWHRKELVCRARKAFAQLAGSHAPTTIAEVVSR